jgi:hypothetical protein
MAIVRSMANDLDRRDHAAPSPTTTPAAPGKSTVTAGMTARRGESRPRGPSGARELALADPSGFVDNASVWDPFWFCAPAVGDPVAVARHGLAGASDRLPHADQIQAAFGADHDLSAVRAQVGGPAAEAGKALSAAAYAHDGAVAFAQQPDLHTAAHEAAHVVQQRGGVQLAGGVGEAGDPYERHADAVADRVVRGESAADLLAAGPAGSGGTAVVQRLVQVGETVYPQPAQARYLRRDLSIALERDHFPGQGTRAMHAQVNEWLEAQEVTPEVFANIEALVARLFQAGLLQRRVQGVPVGPRTLGQRPAFSAQTQEAVPIQDGEHRRHVISSSSLGAAIEDNPADLAAVNGWLQRHDLAIVQPTNNGEMDLRNAKRRVWERVNDHPGNLWAGAGPVNTAIGFMRGPLMQMINDIRAILAQAANDDLPFPEVVAHVPAEVGGAIGAHWNLVRTSLIAGLRGMSTIQNGQNGMDVDVADNDHQRRINGTAAIELVLDYVRNCDLDTPPHMNGDYFGQLRAIYAQVISHQAEIFANGGALDQFLQLNVPAAQ